MSSSDRSNSVIRRDTVAGVAHDVLVCREGDHEFTRVSVRGVKPFYCDIHAARAPKRDPKPKPDTGDDTGEGTPKRTHHFRWPLLLQVVEANKNSPIPMQPYMYGPAGTGKTYAGRNVAKELGAEFRSESCSIGGTEVDFFGFIDANGQVVRTAFREVWEYGGVFLADELDKASPYVLSKLNAAFASSAGESIEFPDGAVPRHAECIILGAGNTDMRGGTEKYHTSQPIDAATMTRFAFIEWGFDEEFEFSLVPDKHAKWVKRIHSLRKAVNDTANDGANVNTSPRAILMGAALRDAGMSQDTIEDLTVWQGVNPDTRRTIESAARRA